MEHLSQQQREDIRAMFEDEWTFDSKFIQDFVPSKEKQRIKDSVKSEMANEGHTIKPGVANRFGGEFGKRVRERLLEFSIEAARRLIWDNQERLREAICVRFDYCKRRTEPQFADSTSLAAGIGDALLASWSQIPLPVVSISVYILKYNLVETLCECNKS